MKLFIIFSLLVFAILTVASSTSKLTTTSTTPLTYSIICGQRISAPPPPSQPRTHFQSGSSRTATVGSQSITVAHVQMKTGAHRLPTPSQLRSPSVLFPAITNVFLTHHDLAPRQVAIPYIPANWTTTMQCPAVFGSPCTMVSKYLPYINDGPRRASEEAARASSSIENGAFVPTMKVRGGAGMVEIGFVFVVATFVATMMAIMVVL